MGKGKPAPWIFLIGILVWTWTFFILTLFTGQSYLQFPTVLLSLAGGFGPLFVSLILIKAGYWDKVLDETVFQFIRRVLNPLTLEPRWYFYIILLVLILSIIPVLLHNLFLDKKELFSIGPLIFILIGIIIGGMEEIGWRAYALEGLQRKAPVILASFIVNLFWAAWHLPLFFMEGTYQAQLGVGTTAFWSFNLAIIISSPIYAWVYNKSGRIAFAVIFYHALGNFSGEVFNTASLFYSLGVEAVIALVLAAYSWQWMKKKIIQ